MGLSLPCHKLDRRRIRSCNSLSRFAGKPDELRRTNTAALNRAQQERKVPPIANPKKRAARVIRHEHHHSIRKRPMQVVWRRTQTETPVRDLGHDDFVTCPAIHARGVRVMMPSRSSYGSQPNWRCHPERSEATAERSREPALSAVEGGLALRRRAPMHGFAMVSRA
jgi:hypothetical protein